ncbi:MAG TPA: thiamine-phosphate kinase [Actinomycetota bacterium]|nr:thiamine-phosphate kinase [Actinomycetota bacterium]
MNVSELGEFGLIERLRALLGPPPEGEVWIGDDAAILRAPGGTILFTADLLVEGIHFDLAWTGPEDLGWKAIAVNASDVAAMGGTPRRALVSLGLRPGLDVGFLEGLYRGMRACCDAFGMAVAGGDLSRCGELVISVALLGNPAGRRVIERSGAEVGHTVCVTGTLGAAAAGLAMLRAGGDARPDLAQAHLRPVPRVREAEVLRRFLPSAMVDVSDGFAADLGHLCAGSGVGATVDADRLPLLDPAGLPAGADPLALALGGGEDYELCFAIASDRAAAAAGAVQEATGTPVHAVGEITAGGLVLRQGADERPLPTAGWDHFRA